MTALTISFKSGSSDMVKIYKTGYGLITLAMVGVYAFYQWDNPAPIPSEELICSGTLNKNVFLPDNSEAVIDASIYFLLRKGNEGAVDYDGTVTHNGAQYRVRRMSNFNYSHDKGSSVYALYWHEMSIGDDDTLPPELKFMVQPDEKKTFLRFRKLERNIMTINRDGIPVIACAIK